MSALVDRLRGVIRPTTGGLPADRPETRPPTSEPYVTDDDGGQEDYRRAGHEHRGGDAAADVLGGEWREQGAHRFLVIDRRYALGYRHGRIAVVDSLPPAAGVWPRLSLLAGATCSGRMLFVDLETTGLAGGAGTYAFLVGCAWFEPPGFRTRQFFLSSFAAERLLLEAVAEAAAASGTVVTYNGKSFDLPLIETRFLLHRMPTPFTGMPHVDMLHPARRLWRSEDDETADGAVRRSVGGGGCRLAALEEALCGHRREGDVPGFEIPSRYFHYVRSGDPRGLQAVMEHNRLDLLSLALVTARAAQLLDEGADAARTAREALGLGRLYERAGLMADARSAIERACRMPGADPHTLAQALRACAVLARRERRHEDAASAWRRLLDLRRCPPHITREAIEALAVHHEHRLRDPRAARTLALDSMRLQQSPSRRQALQHRLARLNRKLGDASRDAAPLFT